MDFVMALSIPTAEAGTVAPGIFHPKYGILEDAAGNQVVFHGSTNETLRGLKFNFEECVIYRSWIDHEKVLVDEYKAEFEEL